MPSFKIDLSSAVVFVATAPTPKVANRQTGEIARDRETGAELVTVGLLISDEGEGNLHQVSVPVTGIDMGLSPGMPVAVTGLRARDWERDNRHGIAFRAVAVTPLAVPAASNGKG
ncbi:hypothetical protein QCN29_31075 [Streptomyces sp. HNM0663]|uniref:Regulatory protein n=1 Tax=Streptomyces chengmaiensis TaxID=3040919 RepID=A0ABT6HWR3_9ACTN|nr:hypothetical protein [Streptomyces chengmaiensis]MDH2393141.1 hypothetical protein [Streptomyces chengmaiensis]